MSILESAGGKWGRIRMIGWAAALGLGFFFTEEGTAAPAEISPRKPDATPDKHEMAPMSDGVRLSTDLYFPPGEGPWPAILMRTPYQRVSGQAAARQGCVGVVQSTRGRFDSEGVAGSFADDGWVEHRDGYDAIRWIVAQPWCNGKVGTSGGSALGVTQNMLASTAPEGLVCQEISKAACNLYLDANYGGGVFRQALVTGWLRSNAFPPEVLQRIIDHPYYDEVQAGVDCSARFALVRVPTFQVAGWYDVFLDGNIRAFEGLQYRGGSGARGRQKILIGPWTHGKTAGELDYPENASPQGAQLEPRRAQWFAHYLKGVDNGVEEWPAVTYYLMGACGEPGAPGNEWLTSDVWPIPHEPKALYLGGGGKLSGAAPAGAEQRLSYRYDPSNPVPTLGGTNLNLDKGPYDQRKVEDRPDALVFTSDPLDKAVEIAGALKARLWASTSAQDTDFTAKLTDVYPDGRSMLVCDGIRRLSLRNGFSRPEFAAPGEVCELEVEMQHTAMAFAPGHRIRLAISSSNAPRFEPNGNHGKPHLGDAEPVVAENTVYVGPDRPSQLILPILKRP